LDKVMADNSLFACQCGSGLSLKIAMLSDLL
jgi:hypothetical protein